jgi:hypothetical protein
MLCVFVVCILNECETFNAQNPSLPETPSYTALVSFHPYPKTTSIKTYFFQPLNIPLPLQLHFQSHKHHPPALPPRVPKLPPPYQRHRHASSPDHALPSYSTTSLPTPPKPHTRTFTRLQSPIKLPLEVVPLHLHPHGGCHLLPYVHVPYCRLTIRAIQSIHQVNLAAHVIFSPRNAFQYGSACEAGARRICVCSKCAQTQIPSGPDKSLGSAHYNAIHSDNSYCVGILQYCEVLQLYLKPLRC